MHTVRLKAGQNEGDLPTLKEISGAWNEYSNVLFCMFLFLFLCDCHIIGC